MTYSASAQAVLEKGLVGVFGDPEVCRSVCPAWAFSIDPIVLSDPDVEGNDVLMPDGVWRAYARIPTTTIVSLRGHVFGDLDPAGDPVTTAGYYGMLDNLAALRTALKTGRSTGTGLIQMVAELDGTPYAGFNLHILSVKSSEWGDGHAAIVVEVEMGGEATYELP